VEELEARIAARASLAPFADLPGAGAAGGLGAALAALGAELVPGAELVLERISFRAAARAAELVVTGEGTVDRTTLEGKAPGAVLRVCREEGVRCAVFAGRVDEPLGGAAMHELPGGPEGARDDLVALGSSLAELLGESL
jgi:glycerate kinase